MKKIALLCGLALVAFGAQPAQAQINDSQIHQISYERFSELETEIASLRSELYGMNGTTSLGCDSCGGGGCNSCGSSCFDSCYGGSGVYFGADFVSITPHVEGDVAATIFEGAGIIDVPFRFDDSETVRFWAGYNDECGYGGRIRFWQFDDSAVPVTLVSNGAQVFQATVNNFAPLNAAVNLNVAGLNNVLVAEYDLNLDVLDLEVTKQLRYKDTTFMFASGVRYVELEHMYRVAGGGPPTIGAPPVFTSSLSHRHGIDAIGPTLGFELWHPVRCTRLTVYAGGRGSVLFGQQSQVWETVGGGAITSSYSRTDDDDVLPVTEINSGVQYDFDSGLFIRGGWEGQIWHGGGGPNSITGDLGMEGFSFTLGVVR